MNTLWAALIIEGYLLTFLLVPVVLLQKRRPPVTTLAWIMAIIMLPYVGSLLFLLFGINRVQRRAALKLASNRELDALLPSLATRQLLAYETTTPLEQRLMRLVSRISNSRALFGNSVEILADTNRTLGFIEQAIGSAQRSIHLEYYIWRSDRTGRRLRDLLIEKARDGVEIRFLFDGFGSLFLGRKFLRPMQEAGIRVASALPGPTFRERWSINLRNHRKIIIVDGKTGFAGGMNIGDEYVGLNRRLGFWRDTHLRMRGPVVSQLQQVFAEDWFFATGEPLTGREWYPPVENTGDQVSQVVAGGPDGQTDVFHSLFFAAINEAKVRVTLATSYFVPTTALLAALESAAQRGVNVRILVPGVADHQWMVVAGRAYYETLLRAGVEIYEFMKGPHHAKTLTIDGAWSLVGSPNFDSRSLMLNFEVAVVLYGPRPARQLEEQFADDLVHAVRIQSESFDRRPLRHRLAEQTLKLFAPVL